MQCVARKPNLASGRLVLPRNALTCMDRSLSARGKGRVGDMGPFLSPTLRVTGEPRFRYTRRHRPKGRRSITSSTTVLSGRQFGPITKRDLHYVTPTSEPPPAIKRSRRRIGDGPQIKGPLPGVSGDGCVGVLTAVRRSFISCAGTRKSRWSREGVCRRATGEEKQRGPLRARVASSFRPDVVLQSVDSWLSSSGWSQSVHTWWPRG